MLVGCVLQVIEDIGLKQRIFADLEAKCSPQCILSTNTSTIDINLVGAKTKAQVRLLSNSVSVTASC